MTDNYCSPDCKAFLLKLNKSKDNTYFFDKNMGRLLAIFGIWLAGFSLGFIGYLVYPGLSQMAVTLWPFLVSLDGQILGAMVAGMASSLITVMAVTIWAYTSKPNAI